MESATSRNSRLQVQWLFCVLCHALFFYRRVARVLKVLLLRTATPRNSPRRREPESRAVTVKQEMILRMSGPPWWAEFINLHIYNCFDWTTFSCIELSSRSKHQSILADVISKLISMTVIIDIISSKLEVFNIYMTYCSYIEVVCIFKGLTCYSLWRKLRNKPVMQA